MRERWYYQLAKRREALQVSQREVAHAAGDGFLQSYVSLAERSESCPQVYVQGTRRGLVRLERAAGRGKRLYRGLRPEQRSRLLSAAVPASAGWAALQRAMIHRAWALFDGLTDKSLEHGDLVCEFLTEPIVDALLHQFFETDDQEPTMALALIGDPQCV